MTDEETELGEALKEALSENQEHAANLVRRLGLVNELVDVLDMAVEGADDHVVRTAMDKTARLVESADALATEDTPKLAATVGGNADSFESAAEKLVRLEESGTLDRLADMADAMGMLVEGADDHVVRSMAVKSALLAESADGLATEDIPDLASTIGANAEEFNDAAETLVRMQKTGTLDNLAEVGDAVTMLNEAADDYVIRSLAAAASSWGELQATVADPDIACGIETIMRGIGDGCPTHENPDRVGRMGLFSALGDDDVQRGLGFFVSMLRNIGQDLERQNQDLDQS